MPIPLFWLLNALVLTSACNLNQEGVRPPANRIFFPGGAFMEDAGPGLGKWLYVVNSNSDLRYNAGTVAAVNLARVRQDYPFDATRLDAAGNPKKWQVCRRDSRWVPPANVGPDDRCCWDFLDPNVLSCDEQIYVNADSSVRIGNFGGRPVMQQLPDRRRMFVPVRGDASIGMIQVTSTPDGVSLLCTGPRTD
ncbi:MAG: hypothetical protein H7X95_09525, partial [Deltaproteobacteria bacterium]|nr:hypothetical protein [Deltaproteobacteria bacterium]